MKNPWKLVKKNIIYSNGFGYTLRNDDVITPAGKPGKFMTLSSRDFVVIVPVTPDGQIIMIRQWRYAMNRECLELPAGGVGENEDILVAAQRELKEETGALSSGWQHLRSYYVGNGIMKVRGHIYLARQAQLAGINHHDDTEKIVIQIYSYPHLLSLVDQNVIDDERSILGLLLVQKYL